MGFVCVCDLTTSAPIVGFSLRDMSVLLSWQKLSGFRVASLMYVVRGEIDGGKRRDSIDEN